MDNKDLLTKKKIELEFYRITRLLPIQRNNAIFDYLAEKVFDTPRLLDLLEIKIKHWFKLEKNEFTYSLAGYIYYFKEEFSKAQRYFLKAIIKNPKNLDNWLNLAFSLYHQEDKKYNLAKKILFNFDYCISYFSNKEANIRTLKTFLRSL